MTMTSSRAACCWTASMALTGGNQILPTCFNVFHLTVWLLFPFLCFNCIISLLQLHIQKSSLFLHWCLILPLFAVTDMLSLLFIILSPSKYFSVGIFLSLLFSNLFFSFFSLAIVSEACFDLLLSLSPYVVYFLCPSNSPAQNKALWGGCSWSSIKKLTLMTKLQ